MPTLSKDATKASGVDPAAMPYGPIGLLVSTLAILLLTTVILLGIAAAAFGVVVALQGFHDAIGATTRFMTSLGGDQDAADRVNVIAGILAYAALIAAIVAVARVRSRRGYADLIGWRPWDMRRGLPLVLLLLAATLLYSLVASTVIEQIYPQAKDWVQAPKGTPWIIAFLAMATLLAPIAEELLFRGWIFTGLRPRIGARWTILVTAILFATAHWESTHLYALAVFPVGLALGFLRQRSDSVAASITFHSIYNGFAAVLLFVAGK